ncbi:MAG TPA: DUF481 domain-containing protein [Candidatus Limnocylindria bacterium]|nr:DUF481 domain-containing protein [Candidatus Limnocylindria bacterium]
MIRSHPSRELILALMLGGMQALAAGKDPTVILHLKNGDRVSGQILSETAGRVVLDTTYGGRIKIAADQIEKRETPAPPPPPAGSQASPPLATTPPAPSAKPSPAPPATISTNALSHSWYSLHWAAPFMTNWHGSVQLGSDLGFGSTDHRNFYVNASASHTYNRIHNLASFSTTYGIVNDVESANRMDGSLKTDIDLGKSRRLYVYNLFGAGYDRIRQIDLQFNEGTGLGYKVINEKKFLLNVESGAEYQHFRYTTSPSRSLYSVRFGENLTWRITDKMTLTHTLSISPRFDDFSDYRAHGTLSLGYPLSSRITINMNLLDDYDSQPPIGAKNNSLQIQTTIGMTF